VLISENPGEELWLDVTTAHDGDVQACGGELVAVEEVAGEGDGPVRLGDAPRP
jgi:hypothetical protein